MTPEEEKFLFGNLANTQQAPIQQAAPQPVAQQQAPQTVVQQQPVAQQLQALPQPNVAGLAQQAASAQQVLNQANPAPQAPSAVSSLGDNLGGANFWNIAGTLGGLWGTAVLANQLLRKNTGVNGQEQVTHNGIEPTMAPPVDTGFNNPTGQNVPAPSETVSPEQKMVQEHVEGVKKEIGKESVPAVPPKVKANDVESMVRSEATKRSKEQEGLSKAVKPKKTAETKSEKTGVPPDLTKEQKSMWKHLVGMYGGGEEGQKAAAKVAEILGYQPAYPKGQGGSLSSEETAKVKAWREQNMQGPKINLTHEEKQTMKAGGKIPFSVAPPEQHGMHTTEGIVLNPMNPFEGINKAKQEK